MTQILLIIILSPILAFIWIMIENRTKKDLNFSFKDFTLSITKRDTRFSQIVKIIEDTTAIATYSPEKYIYTGVTVGGITTGGVSKVGGYGTKAVKNGRYNLELVNQRGGTIQRIKLTPKLSQKARESVVAQYLSEQGDEIIVVLPYDSKINGKEVGVFSPERRPTYEKCKDILNWLCMKE